MIYKLLITLLSTGVLFYLFGCNGQDRKNGKSLFEEVDPSHSGVRFVNALNETKDFNIIEYLYFYNGAGVAIGDINNDGLPDLYFSGNQVDNKLYLNKGNFAFDDITVAAGVEGKGNWKTGVTMADANADGLLDIFVCGVGSYKDLTGFNQLYINNGDLTFTERTDEFGLRFRGFSTHSAFFDYDLDGDLDMYLLNHSVHTQRSYGRVSLRNRRDPVAGDRLYRNLLSETGKTFFEDVTAGSGIYSSALGYGLGLGISDLNRDGYPDIYVSNDFVENDYVYINNRDGTFSQQAEKVTGHTSRFSMGNDIADVNNDGWTDILTLDMLPEDEAVIKTSAGEDSYEVYNFKLKYGYHRQVSRNALQINNGQIGAGGQLVFTDVAPAAGVEATDWSWAPLMVDFDGDGWKDVFISNGIVRRPNDMDYISFISSDSVQRQDDVLPWISKMPEGKVSNFIFRNRGDLTFADKTVEWGLSAPSFSSGAAYGDLDNDGDPDLVVSRINETPFIYRNNADREQYVKVYVHGDSLGGNPFAIGARVIASQGDVVQTHEIFPSRGWCSSSDYAVTIGLRHPGEPVNVQVVWPDGKTRVQASERGTLHFRWSSEDAVYDRGQAPVKPLLLKADAPDFLHREDEFNAFSRESLMPHMLTNEGPPIAAGDVNGDGIDDVFIGGAKNQAGALFLQSKEGRFVKQHVPDFQRHRLHEDVSAAFFDADGDGDEDLVVASGGQEAFRNSELIQPRLYLNTEGVLRFSASSFPGIHLHASCVKPNDYDDDGDIDLFIGASVMPMLYGMAPVSYLLVNNGSGKFHSDSGWLGTSEFENPTRVRPGMVRDAVWADINNDHRDDLVLAGEWMPVTVLLQQADHRFRNATKEMGLAEKNGWWNTVVVNDFDGDGDLDLVAGNLGWNSRLKASAGKPLQMYLGDFDSNGGSDHILVYYNGDKSYPFASRDALVRQLPGLKKKFLNYRDYRNVRLEDIVTPQQKGNSAMLHADDFSSMYFQNNDTSFQARPLPFEAQLFPVFGIEVDDIDSDGAADMLLAGNLSVVQPDLGPYDAGIGLVLKGKGDGTFEALSPARSGFVVRGEGRDIITVTNAVGEKIYLVSRNNDTVKSFKINKHDKEISPARLSPAGGVPGSESGLDH